MNEWRKSSRCTFDKPQCVELRGDLAAVRDSKTGDALRGVTVRALVSHVKGLTLGG